MSNLQRIFVTCMLIMLNLADNRNLWSRPQDDLADQAARESIATRISPKESLDGSLTAGPINYVPIKTNSQNDALALDRSSVPDRRVQWSGLDRFLNRHAGLTIEPIYYGEVFSNTRGGISTNDSTRYQGLLDLGLELNLDEIGSFVPGSFFMLTQNSHGRGLTGNFTGDAQVLSNIDSGGDIMRVSEYWWELKLVNDNVTVRLGKQDVNTEFLFLDSAADFIQSSFGLTPALALPTYPDQSVGAVILTQLTDSLQLKVGVWDALAFKRSWGFSGNDTLFIASELEYDYTLANGTLPGTIAFGAGYLSQSEIMGVPLDASHGYVLQMEQLLWREFTSENDIAQGLGAFFSYVPRYFGERVPTGRIGDNYVGGVVYRGLIPRRDEDVLGVGVAWAELFQGGTNHETVFECFYKAQIAPGISFQPDLQYIASPSGIHRDALVIGTRIQLNL